VKAQTTLNMANLHGGTAIRVMTHPTSKVGWNEVEAQQRDDPPTNKHDRSWNLLTFGHGECQLALVGLVGALTAFVAVKKKHRD